MSQKAALDFVGLLAVDSAVRQELSGTLSGATDTREALQRAVEFAAGRGFEVTPAELSEFALADDELTDEQLANVAGGAGIATVPPVVVGKLRLKKPAGINCFGYDCSGP
jgi:hypothetical protein